MSSEATNNKFVAPCCGFALRFALSFVICLTAGAVVVVDDEDDDVVFDVGGEKRQSNNIVISSSRSLWFRFFVYNSLTMPTHTQESENLSANSSLSRTRRL